MPIKKPLKKEAISKQSIADLPLQLEDKQVENLHLQKIPSKNIEGRIRQIESNICTNLHDFDQAILHNVVFPLILKHFPKELHGIPAVFSPLSEIFTDYFTHFWANLQLVKKTAKGGYFKVAVGGEYRSLWHPQIYVLSQEVYSDDLGKYVSKAIRSSLKNIGKREELENKLEARFKGLSGKRYLFGDLARDINDYELRAYRTPELEIVDNFLQDEFKMEGQTYNPDISIYRLMETVKTIAQLMDKVLFGKRKISIFMQEENALYIKTKIGLGDEIIPQNITLNNLAEFIFLSRAKAAGVLKRLSHDEAGVSQRQYGAVVRYINWLVKMMNIEIVSEKTKDALENELMLLFKERDRVLQEINGIERVFEFKAKVM